LLGCTTHAHPTQSYETEVAVTTGRNEAIASLEIRLSKGVRPANGDSYNAQEVKNTLSEKL